MATFWMDLKNGNDANAGTFAAPWLTFPLGPTAARIAPGDTVRIMRTAKSTLANTTWTNNSATVTIPASTILDIETAVGNTWTVAANVTGSTSSARRLGATAQQLSIAAGFTTGKVAHKATGTLNLSAYTKFSFNFRAGGAISAGWLTVRLCSDTTGDTPVHTFTVPSMAASTMYQFTFDNGAALSSSIQSISINAVTDPGTVALVINNVIAHNDLGLGSLVGPSDTESFFPVLSISGTTLILDGSYSVAAAGKVWSGTTGSYTMTLRDSVYTQSSNIGFNEGNNSLNYTLSGGWENETTQNGYTLIRNVGFSITQNGWSIENIGICNTTVVGFAQSSTAVIFWKNIVVSNSSTAAFSFQNNSLVVKFDGLRIYSSVGTFGSSGNLKALVYNSHFIHNSASGSIGADWLFSNCVFKMNTSAHFSALPPGNATFRKCEIVGGLFFSSFQIYGGFASEEGTIGSSYPVNITYAFGTVRWQTTIKQGSDPGAWEVTGMTSSTTQKNPIEWQIATVLCTENVLKTVTVWMKKDHATNTTLSVFAEGNRLTGVNETETLKANDTDWQQVSISFTPTETGVIGIFARVWCTVSFVNSYVGSITVT